jgi:hypothetical protein
VSDIRNIAGISGDGDWRARRKTVGQGGKQGAYPAKECALLSHMLAGETAAGMLWMIVGFVRLIGITFALPPEKIRTGSGWNRAAWPSSESNHYPGHAGVDSRGAWPSRLHMRSVDFRGISVDSCGMAPLIRPNHSNGLSELSRGLWRPSLIGEYK